jgi:cell division protein FtsB
VSYNSSSGRGSSGDVGNTPRAPEGSVSNQPPPPAAPESLSEAAAGGAVDASKKSTVETILQSTQEWNQTWNRTYMDLEASIMERIHSSNKRRFRGILLSTLIVITWFFATFGSKIKQTLTRQTADIAKETLENKSLQIQTQELARAVVQTILNDKEVTLRAAVFVREALSTPETKDALLNLLYDLVQHPKTQDALAQVTKSVIAEVINDKVSECDFTSFSSLSVMYDCLIEWIE